MHSNSSLSLMTATTLILALGGCSLMPEYQRPTVDVPTQFKESRDWKIAQPQDALKRGAWWTIYQDPLLDNLIDQISVSNQSLLAAEAKYRQAQATLQGSRAGFFPTVNGSGSVTRSDTGTRTATTDYKLGLSAAWEADIWGRIRSTVESSNAGAQAGAADVESVRLSLQTTLAQNYFLLRIADEKKRLLDKYVEAYAKALQITQNRYRAGVSPQLDVTQAETQLKSAQAQAVDTGVQRAQLEHAIAILLGKAPAGFAIEPIAYKVSIPGIPAGVPSTLLERRPDIAAAERRVAAANAQIGVAKAAFFPSLTLSAAAGLESSSFSHWLSAPSQFWSLGPLLAQTLFDGGLRKSRTAQAQAAYEGSVNDYRQTVLTSFQEVEDHLATLRILEQEHGIQEDAIKSAQKTVDLVVNQYKGGTVSYLNVTTTQTNALTAERTGLDLLGRRLVASVLLIKALGGGWS